MYCIRLLHKLTEVKHKFTAYFAICDVYSNKKVGCGGWQIASGLFNLKIRVTKHSFQLPPMMSNYQTALF